MRVIYALRDNPLRDARELRYSLRSLHKYGYANAAVVCGARPSWYVGRHVHERDLLGTHQLNMTHKLGLAMNSSGPEVVWMCDDYFLPRPFDHRHHHGLPLRRTVENLQKTRHEREWTRRMMEETLQYLLDQGVKDPLNFVTHTPFWMEKQPAKKAMSICLTSKTGMELATIYGNLYANPYGRLFHEDVKLRHPDSRPKEGWPSFSTDPSQEDEPWTLDLLERYCPSPSCCERP